MCSWCLNRNASTSHWQIGMQGRQNCSRRLVSSKVASTNEFGAAAIDGQLSLAVRVLAPRSSTQPIGKTVRFKSFHKNTLGQLHPESLSLLGKPRRQWRQCSSTTSSNPIPSKDKRHAIFWGIKSGTGRWSLLEYVAGEMCDKSPRIFAKVVPSWHNGPSFDVLVGPSCPWKQTIEADKMSCGRSLPYSSLTYSPVNVYITVWKFT